MCGGDSRSSIQAHPPERDTEVSRANEYPVDELQCADGIDLPQPLLRLHLSWVILYYSIGWVRFAYFVLFYTIVIGPL